MLVCWEGDDFDVRMVLDSGDESGDAAENGRMRSDDTIVCEDADAEFATAIGPTSEESA